MAGTSVEPGHEDWQDWTDPVRGRDERVRWAAVFSEDMVPGVGLIELRPGGVMTRHHHAPAEVYHVISGDGEVEIEGETHVLRVGSTVHVPPDAWHETRSTGSETLRILYFFPTASFAEVDYHFD